MLQSAMSDVTLNQVSTMVGILRFQTNGHRSRYHESDVTSQVQTAAFQCPSSEPEWDSSLQSEQPFFKFASLHHCFTITTYA